MTPLITVAGTLSGVFLGTRLTQHQRRQEDHQSRRVLATMLLSELRSLEKAPREACQQSPETTSIVFAQMATFNQGGAHLLLFSPDTLQALTDFYHQVPEVQALARVWNADRQLLGPVHEQLRQCGITTFRALPEVASRLRNAEQGEWPRKVSASAKPPPSWAELSPSVF
jgi:hypothetical protein